MSSLIGQRIRELRIARGLSQTQLAKGIVTPSMISQIEAGKAHPSNSLLKKIAKRLEAPEDALTIAPSQDDAILARMEVINSCLTLGRLEDAERLIHAAMDLPTENLEFHFLKGKLLLIQKMFAGAYVEFETALKLSREQARFEYLPELYLYEGDTYQEVGDHDTAVHLYDQALRHLHKHMEKSGLLEARISMRMSEAKNALGYEAEAYRYAERAGERVALGVRSRQLAQEQLTRAIETLLHGNDGEAKRLASEARSLFDVFRWLESSIEVELILVRQALQKGDLDYAREHLFSCETRSASFADSCMRTRMMYLESELLFQLGEYEKGLDVLENTLNTCETLTDDRAKAYLRGAKVAESLKNYDLAITFADSSYRESLPLNQFVVAAEASKLLARLYRDSGNVEQAEKSLRTLEANCKI